jgi:hypothetical protein
MRMLTLPLLIVSGLVLAACESQPPSAPDGGGGDNLVPVSGIPLASANASCRYSTNGGSTPATIVNIPVGTGLTLYPTTGHIADCDGAYGVLSATDGRLEFNLSGSPCTDFEQQEAGASLLKVYRCFAGGAALTIYTSSSKTTVLQTIGIDVQP